MRGDRPAGEPPAVAAAPAIRVRRVEGAPVVAVRAWLPGGARDEIVPGTSYLTGRLLAEGTRRRSWRDLADWIEAHGMVLHTSGSFESHGVAVDALADDWQAALELAAEVIVEAAFPDERAAWAARQVAAELESLGDQPEVRTAWAFLEQLYHPHRRALPLQGTADSLATIAAADCAEFHTRGLAGGVRVAIAGMVDEDAVAARAERLFAGLAAGADGNGRGAAGVAAEVVAIDHVPPAPAGRGARRVVRLPVPPGDGEDGEGDDGEDGDSGQAHLYLGHLTVERRHEDFEALEAAGVVLGAGAGLTGRIPERIREREGLAYTATAQTASGAGFDPGRLVVYVGTGVDTVEAAEAAAREELARFVEEGPTAGEVADAVAYLVGREPFRRETARQWADLLAEGHHYRLPLDHPTWRRDRLRRLTRDEVAAAVARHLRPEEVRVTVGLPGEEGTGPDSDRE